MSYQFPQLTASRCYSCYQIVDSPEICIYEEEVNERLKFCTKKCFKEYYRVVKRSEIKPILRNTMVQPSESSSFSAGQWMARSTKTKDK